MVASATGTHAAAGISRILKGSRNWRCRQTATPMPDCRRGGATRGQSCHCQSMEVARRRQLLLPIGRWRRQLRKMTAAATARAAATEMDSAMERLGGGGNGNGNGGHNGRGRGTQPHPGGGGNGGSSYGNGGSSYGNGGGYVNGGGSYGKWWRRLRQMAAAATEMDSTMGGSMNGSISPLKAQCMVQLGAQWMYRW